MRIVIAIRVMVAMKVTNKKIHSLEEENKRKEEIKKEKKKKKKRKRIGGKKWYRREKKKTRLPVRLLFWGLFVTLLYLFFSRGRG